MNEGSKEDAEEDRERSTQVEQRVLTEEERRQLDEMARPGAVYQEAGWTKTAREDLRRIERAIDELEAPESSPRAVARKRRSREGELPAGLRSRVTDALGAVAYVQLVYSTKRHHVCHVGLREDGSIEDVIVLVGPDGVRRFEDLADAIDHLTTDRTPSPPRRVAPEGPFGQVYEVEKIEGIGPEYTEKLLKLGIEDTRALWQANPRELTEAIDVSRKRVDRWRSMSELMAISGIGPQYAELLTRSGIGSIEDLADADPEELLEGIQAKQKKLQVRIQGNIVKRPRVEGWIEDAKAHTQTEGT